MKKYTIFGKEILGVWSTFMWGVSSTFWVATKTAGSGPSQVWNGDEIHENGGNPKAIRWDKRDLIGKKMTVLDQRHWAAVPFVEVKVPDGHSVPGLGEKVAIYLLAGGHNSAPKFRDTTIISGQGEDYSTCSLPVCLKVKKCVDRKTLSTYLGDLADAISFGRKDLFVDVGSQEK